MVLALQALVSGSSGVIPRSELCRQQKALKSSYLKYDDQNKFNVAFVSADGDKK